MGKREELSSDIIVLMVCYVWLNIFGGFRKVYECEADLVE